MSGFMRRLVHHTIDPFIEGCFGDRNCKESSAFVKGQVEIGNAMCSLDVVFMIDTGSTFTLLLDTDLLNACKTLGWKPYADAAVFNWIHTNPSFEYKGPLYSVGGVTIPVYRINHSRLKYYRTDQTVLDRKLPCEPPVYGTFTVPFVKGLSPSHVSLLGVDNLNTQRQFLWSWPRLSIRLTY